jgi:hypothetical protein
MAPPTTLAGGLAIVLKFPTRGARKALQATAARLPRGFGILLDRGAAIHKEELEKRTPIGKGLTSGETRRSWFVRKVGAGAGARRVVANKKKHIIFLFRGRGAIDNTGRGYPLHFWISGKEFYRWKVGPARANPFHKHAARAARRRIVQLMPGEVARLISVRGAK